MTPAGARLPVQVPEEGGAGYPGGGLRRRGLALAAVGALCLLLAAVDGRRGRRAGRQL